MEVSVGSILVRNSYPLATRAVICGMFAVSIRRAGVHAVRLHKIIMRSGASLEVVAKVFHDDQALDCICFYQDEARQHLVASIKRDQVAGIILHQSKSGVFVATARLPEPRR